MDYRYIEQLLDRYWQGETTLAEEQILRTFFAQDDVPANLAKYKSLFAYEQSETTDDVLSDDFDERMLALIDEPEPVKARTISIRQRFAPLIKAAAAVAVFLVLGNAAQMMFDTGDNAPIPTSAVQNTEKGASVAMGDSVKKDTLKKVPSASVILK